MLYQNVFMHFLLDMRFLRTVLEDLRKNATPDFHS